jgi:hypothetical protein
LGILVDFLAFVLVLEVSSNVEKWSSLNIQSAYRAVNKSPVRGSRYLIIDED